MAMCTHDGGSPAPSHCHVTGAVTAASGAGWGFAFWLHVTKTCNRDPEEEDVMWLREGWLWWLCLPCHPAVSHAQLW